MNAINEQNAKPLDLTYTTVSGWEVKGGSALPVLIVNPQATLHQRSALAWVMAQEAAELLEAGRLVFESDDKGDKALMHMATERMRQLATLLEDIGDRTAALEGGAA